MRERYLEDFAAGQVYQSQRRVRVDKDEIVGFARKFDPQSFHIDEAAALASPFKGLIASGWHTAALTMSLIASAEFSPAGGTVGLGFDNLRWPLPVRPGDELRIESEVLEVRPSATRPDRGVVKIRTRTLNQDDRVVQELTANLMVPRRPGASSN